MESDRATALDACIRVTEEMRSLLPEIKPHKIKTLSRYFAEKITSDDQQDVLLLVDGKRGTGKSTSALSLAEAISKQVSIILYGDASHADEFFNIENVAVIDPQECFKLVSKLDKPHSVIILDDIGVALSHHKSQTNINQLIDSLIQICRVRQVCIIMTSPSIGFISKTTRLCASYIMHLVEPHHTEGFNLASVKTVEQAHLANKTIYPFLLASELGSTEIGCRRAKINRWKIYSPRNKELIRQYDIKRNEETQKQLDITGEKIEYLLKKEHAKATGNDDMVIAKTADLTKADKIDKLIEKQGYSMTQACKIAGLSKYKYKIASDYYKTVLVVSNAKS